MAFDVRAIGVPLMIQVMMDYIRFHRWRQQICHQAVACNSLPNVRGRDVAVRQIEADESLWSDGQVQLENTAFIQVSNDA